MYFQINKMAQFSGILCVMIQWSGSALYFLYLSGIFLFITGYFLLGILQWYQSIILAQPVVYDIRKEIIQSNSSCNSRNAVGKRAKIKKVKFWSLELGKTFYGFFWVLFGVVSSGDLPIFGSFWQGDQPLASVPSSSWDAVSVAAISYFSERVSTCLGQG